ncbi:MAG: isoprenyl transferase [Porphyromonadaceae bacterium]|nr:isoprenyl transferase [Porphyromonadaceae bacterium]
MSLFEKIDHHRIPSHIAIIMDGNGRWAKARGLERAEGHREGVTAIRTVVKGAIRASVQTLTLYAFSTENWLRPEEEIEGLMDLIVYAIANETADLKKNGVSIASIGDMSRLPENVRESLENCIRETSGGRNLKLVIALSYSSRWELTEATRQISEDVIKGVLKTKDIDEETIGRYLTTCNLTDPDLLIRTGGELRISNFLLWQCAYTEFYFTETFWPDFGEEALYKAILDFQCRERRYGKTSEQIESDK